MYTTTNLHGGLRGQVSKSYTRLLDQSLGTSQQLHQVSQPFLVNKVTRILHLTGNVCYLKLAVFRLLQTYILSS